MAASSSGVDGPHHPVEHGLAVLRLADLEKAGLARRLDEVAGRVDEEEAHRLALDLAAEDHRGVEVEPRLLERRAVLVVDATHRGAEHAARIEHAGRVPDRDRRAVAVFEFLDLQDLAHLLGDREVAGREHHHEAVARPLVDHHLAERGDLVEAGIGARVGEEDKAGVELDGYAIGHGCSRCSALEAVERVERFAGREHIGVERGDGVAQG